MEQIDLKLKLIGGIPIHAEGYGDIRPLTVGEITRYGYSDYLVNLNLLNLDTDDFLKDSEELADEELNPDEKPCVLDVIIAFGGEELGEQLEKALSFFLGGEAIVDQENLQVLINISEDDVRAVNRGNYESITKIIKYQNYIIQFDEKSNDSFKPVDEKTRKFKERMEELKKKRDAVKKKSSESNDETDIDFYDIISALSSKSYSINELNMMELTVYQVYSKFKRMEIIDQYGISIKTVLAGGKDVKIKHWSSKLD